MISFVGTKNYKANSNVSNFFLQILSPSGQEIFSGRKETEGEISFVADTDGLHTFCFANTMSRVSTKKVTLEIVVGEAIPMTSSELARQGVFLRNTQ